jgi:cytochrome c oxidase cbb3-type subunit III
MKNTEKENEKPIHLYDGIIELDNPTPFWFNVAFYLSMAVAAGYIGYYLFGGGPTIRENLARDLNQISLLKMAEHNTTNPDEKTLLAVFTDSGRKEKAKTTFVAKCASCHLADGGGMIGPNLADNHWINGNGKIASIYKTVKEGVSDKGMPPWGPLLTPQELEEVTAYVYAFKGTQPAKPKPPQGTHYE